MIIIAFIIIHILCGFIVQPTAVTLGPAHTQRIRRVFFFFAEAFTEEIVIVRLLCCAAMERCARKETTQFLRTCSRKVLGLGFGFRIANVPFGVSVACCVLRVVYYVSLLPTSGLPDVFRAYLAAPTRNTLDATQAARK